RRAPRRPPALAEALADPRAEPLSQLVADVTEQVAAAGEHDELAPRKHLHELARLRRQDLVVRPMEEQHRRSRQTLRLLAAGGLSGERHAPGGVAAEHDPGPNGARPAEGVAHRDKPSAAAPRRELGHRDEVVDARAEVVGLAVPDAHHPDALLGEADAE